MQDVCHCSFIIWLLFNVFVSSFIWNAFSSKKFVLNISIFACGMEFSSLGGFSVVGGIQRASSVFGSIYSVTGEWYEFRLWSLFVVDEYRALLVVLM